MGRLLSQPGLTAIAATLTLWLASNPPARAQMAVYDAAAHAETSQTLAQTIKIFDSATQQLNQLTALKSAFGSVGASSGGLASPLRSLNASLTPPAMNFDGWNLPLEMQSPNFGSMSSSRAFLGQGRKIIRYNKPLSTLLLAPAGTGKTRSTIIPTALSYKGSVIVHDPKGEVYDNTAGFRSKLGRVLRIEWSSPVRSLCWNPLSAGNLPTDAGERGNAVDRLCAVAIPGDSKSFWISSPRLALSAITLFLVYESERTGGAEATFSGALSWLAAGMAQAAEEDPLAVHFERAAGIAEIEGYPERIATGLRLIAQLNYKTRADVIGTINASLGIFLNSSVAAVTSRSDFTLRDLRGADGKPASLYIVVPQNDMAAFAPVTG